MKLFIAAVLVAVVAAKLSSSEKESHAVLDLSPYKPGHEYRYRFESQIASGIAEISHQKALTRIQADAVLYFNSERTITLRLENVRAGASSARKIEHAEQIHPFSLVEQKEIEPEHLNMLSLPLQFNYEDGLIEKISFDAGDDVWSKNIKRSVLNLLQVNLKARNLSDEQKNEVRTQDPSWKTLTPRMFTAPEMTIEGECETTYVINKLENKRNNDMDFFNVTKTVDFRNCKKMADVTYGPQVERRLVEQWQEQSRLQSDEEEQEQKLRRSTILRHVVVGTPEKFAIKKVESVSQYSFKTFNAEQETPMVSVVVNELTCIEVNKNPSEQQSAPRDTRDEPLLYSNDYDRDVKRFYMNGDEEFTGENSPFFKIQNKQKMIISLLSKINQSIQNKKTGVDSDAAVLLTRLVELLRTCSVAEIEDIISRTDGTPLDLLYDALILAATRNTIYVLSEKIVAKKISTPKAIQALKALSGSPAPSEKQIEILTKLCKSDPAKKSESLRQSCWLTVGTLIGELCETSQQNSYVINKKATNELCPRHVTDKFTETFDYEYRRANNRYEKILILKAIGNAGLEESLPKLKQTIYDEKEDPLVRAQAIDSLRRLVDEIPTQVQSVLMPVFKNQQELTELRLHALSLVMQTRPDNGVLDQIASVLVRERSKNVRSFVYDIVQAYSQSPIAREQKLAQHLKAVVKLVGISEKEQEKMGSSSAYRVPIYSSQQDEGVFLNLESMFASDNALPKKISAGIDTFLNGIFEKGTMEVVLQQEDVERWYEKILNAFYPDSERSDKGRDELSRIFSNLDMSERRNNRNRRQYTTPFGFLSLRMRNIDYALLPLEEESLPEALRKLIIDGQRPSLHTLSPFSSWMNGEVYKSTSIWNFYERLTKIPTAAGIPLKLTLTSPVLSTIETSGKFRASGVLLKTHPSIAASFMQKIEAWFPVVNSGVEKVVTGEYNIPIEVELMHEKSDNSFKLSAIIPEDEYRVLGFHTLPVTYIREYDSETRVHKEPRVKTIRNERMEQYQTQWDNVYGEKTVKLPFHVRGQLHYPSKMSYSEMFNAIMTTENHWHVMFKPTESTPNSVELKLSGEWFGKNEGRLRPTFTNFYDKFDNQMEKEYRFQETYAQDEQSLGKALSRYESRKSYKHGFQAELKTIKDAQVDKSAKLEVGAVCDEKLEFCKTQLKVRRDPIFEEEENREWKMETNVQVILPEYSVDYQQYQAKKEEKNHRFVCSIDCSWGTDEQQYVNIRVNGEHAKTREWMDVEKSESKRKGVDVSEKSAFLNKFDVSAEYKMESGMRSFVSSYFGLVKISNFFNTQVNSNYGQLKKFSSSTGLVTALVVIDPISRQHVNLTVNTASEKVHIDSIPMPMKIAPFSLVRRESSTKSIKSAQNLLSTIVSKKGGNQECSVDGQQVRTFDAVSFKAPITKCYTVLAKDCNRESSFAVLLKKTNNENKKLKIVYKNGNIVEVEKDTNDSETKFRVTVNGDSIRENDWEEYDISQLDNVMIVESRDLNVRFNGRQAWVKTSSFYKNNVCGICGHYDDDQENEFVKGNNEKTADIRQYFRSFTLKDEECQSDFDEMTQKSRFETIDSNEYGQDSSNSRENEEEDPLEKTLVMEYNHKVCFSMKPIRECPRNRYPTNQSNNVKIQFTCLARDSADARRFLRQLKTENVIEELRTMPPSFVDNVKVPTKCVEL